MKKEAKKLLNKAIDSLILSVEHFNRPHEVGRSTASLIFIDHAMEMLLKASIRERGGDINNKDRTGQKIGFDACVGRGLSDGQIQFLSEDQAKLLRMINGQRDAAQHYLVDVSEELLYLLLQAGVGLIRDVMLKVFLVDLNTKLPARVLPISTTPPTDLQTLFEREISIVRQMLAPGNRQRIEAEARLRSLIIVDKALIGGDVQQPSASETRKRATNLTNNSNWRDVFPGVASLQVDSDTTDHKINFVMSKRLDGIPIINANNLSDDKTGAAVIIQRVNEFDRFSMTLYTLAEHLGLTQYQTQAIVWHLKIKENSEAYKEFRRNTQVIKGYSQTALQLCREALTNISIQDICESYRQHQREKRKPRRIRKL